jgi:hypothetical protein
MADLSATGHHPIEIDDLPTMVAASPRGVTRTYGRTQIRVAFLPESLPKDQNPLPIHHVVHQWVHRQLHLLLHAMIEAEGSPDVVRQLH